MSLRARLVIGAVLALVLALGVGDVLVYRAMRDHLVERLDRSLDDARLPGDGDLAGPAGDRRGPGTNDGPSGAPSDGGRVAMPVATETRRVDDSVERSVPATLLDGTRSMPALPARLAFAADVASGTIRRFDVQAVEPGGPRFRVKAVKLASGVTLVIATPTTALDDTLGRLRNVELVVSAAALALGALLTFAVVTVALAPLRKVERAAAAVAAGDLDVRAALGPATSEVAQLGEAFDTMVDRLTTALDERTRAEARVRQFVADGAHELRTPVAAVAAYAELIERGASARPEDLGRAVRGIRSESARLGDLVDDLLVLARLDAARDPRREPVELVSIAADAVAAANAIGPAWPATLRATEPVDTVGDPDAIRRAVDNLLANVRTHTPEGTKVEVRVARNEDGSLATIVVTDDGPGLAPDDHERAFERFWRADASRTRASGGAGLGLSIVAAIADAHGGRAEMRSSPGRGVTVVLELPVEPPAGPS